MPLPRPSKRFLFAYFPEILILSTCTFFLTADLLYSPSPTFLTGILAFCLISLFLLLRWKNRFLAVFLAISIGIAGVFFELALWAEYREFPKNDPAGTKLLLTGTFLFGGFFILAWLLPRKYFRKEQYRGAC